MPRVLHECHLPGSQIHPLQSAHGVTGTQALLEAVSKGNQHRITAGMPQAVVDVFKMVDIQKYHRGDFFSVALGLRDYEFLTDP